MSCAICDANSGKQRISPGPVIFAGKYWNVEHAYPASLLGWVVVVLGRHCEELHSLTFPEWEEFGRIQHQLLHAIVECLATEREYLACFAEKAQFRHIHFHVVPKTLDFDPQYVGTKAFHYINADLADVLEPGVVASFCLRLAQFFPGGGSYPPR